MGERREGEEAGKNREYFPHFRSMLGACLENVQTKPSPHLELLCTCRQVHTLLGHCLESRHNFDISTHT